MVPIYGDDERTVQGLQKMYYIHCGVWSCNRPYATFHATEQEAKEIFDNVLENRALPAQKNIVLANAAFGIQVLERGEKSIEECIAIARESIDSGSALRTFKKFVELNS